jgi:hypothetical protein
VRRRRPSKFAREGELSSRPEWVICGKPPNSRTTRSHCTCRSSLPPRCVLKPFDRPQYAFTPLRRLLYCAASFPSPHPLAATTILHRPATHAKQVWLVKAAELALTEHLVRRSRKLPPKINTRNYELQNAGIHTIPPSTPCLKQRHSFFGDAILNRCGRPALPCAIIGPLVRVRSFCL